MKLLLLLVFTAACAFSAEPINVTWRVKERGLENLVINGVEVALSWARPTERELSKLSKAIGPDAGATRPVRITIPAKLEPQPRLKPFSPNLSTSAVLVFSSFTNPKRSVTYIYRGKELHRYRLVCSTETIDPQFADYWLDDEYLGKWEQAKERLLNPQTWLQDSIVDALVEVGDPSYFLKSGGWYFPGQLTSELMEVLKQRTLMINLAVSYPKAKGK